MAIWEGGSWNRNSCLERNICPPITLQSSSVCAPWELNFQDVSRRWRSWLSWIRSLTEALHMLWHVFYRNVARWGEKKIAHVAQKGLCEHQDVYDSWDQNQTLWQRMCSNLIRRSSDPFWFAGKNVTTSIRISSLALQQLQLFILVKCVQIFFWDLWRMQCCSKKEPCSSSITLFGKLSFVPVSYYLLPIVKCLSTETLSLSSSVDSCLFSPWVNLGEPFITAERSDHKAAELWLQLKLGVHWAYIRLGEKNCLELFLRKCCITEPFFFFPLLKISFL